MHLFVYGTLRRAAGHPMYASLSRGGSFVSDARARGRLYLIAHYPGLVVDETSGWVVGELYRLRDPSVLEQLDHYEGVDGHDPEYRRLLHWVTLADGSDRRAWIYEYARDPRPHARIESGDFLRCERLVDA